VMDAAEAVATCRLAPDATVIATHMDSLDHATVSRDELRRHATEQGVSPQQLLIPRDGETLQLTPRQA
jgi:L-ascorbate metabolism protein UlaG (beta-lactamase superfamily)